MAEGKQTLIPIDKVISYMIHGPRIRISEDKASFYKSQGLDHTFPLYARSDRQGYEGRTPEWLQAVQTTYNSPRNIRALYISASGVTVWYWTRGDLGQGKTVLSDIKRTVQFSSVPAHVSNIQPMHLGATLQEIQSSILGISQYPAYLAQKHIWLKGNPLTALSSNWSLANLEELYFDNTLLLSVAPNVLAFLNSINRITCDIRPTAEGNLVYKPFNVYHINNTAKNEIDRKAAQTLYAVIRNIATKDGTNKVGIPGYPRLKYIGFISQDPRTPHAHVETLSPSQLSKYETNEIGDTKELADFTEDTINTYNKVGMTHEIIQHLALNNKTFRTGIFLDTGVDLYKVGFSTLQSWKFDEDFLINFFEKKTKEFVHIQYAQLQKTKKTGIMHSPGHKELTKKRHEEHLKQITPTASKDLIDNTATAEEEKLLNKTYLEDPHKAVATLLTLRDMFGDKRLGELLDTFTPRGKQLYTSLLKSKQ